MRLYHGTTKENYSEIKRDGFLAGPVYLTPKKNLAEDYAANNSPDYVVFEIEIDFSELKYDREFVNEPSVTDSLKAGSVYVDRDININGAKETHYIDYEAI